MASESAMMDCSDNVESESASTEIGGSDNELLLPAAAIEPTSMEKMPATVDEPMAIDDGQFDSLNPESDRALGSVKSNVAIENIKESEIDNSNATDENKKSEATSLTSSKEDIGSSVEKLDSTKPTETDLDSSIEIISSPITEDADVDADAADEERKSYNEDSDTPAQTEATGCTSVDQLDSAKAIDVDLDSSIEMIDSPGENPMSSKELSQKDNQRTRIDSDSSIELISSSGKDTSADSSNKESPTANTQSLSENKQKEVQEKETIQKDDIAGKIKETKDAEISTDTGEAMHDPTNAESAHGTFQSETDTRKEKNPILSKNLDETGIENKQVDEPMETEDTLNVCKEKDIGLTELNWEEASKANIGKKKERTDELGVENEIYYKKDCINCNCKKLHTQYVRASVAALNYYKVTRKTRKRQYICMDCYDVAMEVYEVGETLDNYIDSS